MDVLLLTAVDPFSYQIIPDLGLMYLASSVKAAGLEVSLKDLRKDKLDYEWLAEYVRKEQPAIVGIKCYSHEVNRVKKMSELIRAAQPQAKIVVGGPHPSMDPAGTLAKMPAVDYVFLGESEWNFRAFSLWVKQGAAGPLPDTVQGIAFREGPGVVIRQPVFEEDLGKLPMAAWDMVNPRDYPDEATGIFVSGFPAPPMMLSRGCPIQCAYCGSRYVMGEKVRYRPVANILEEIAFLEQNYGIRNFTFVDDNYTMSRTRAMELFEALAVREPQIAFTFPNGLRPRTLDAELLKAMEKAGCYALALGIESGSDETLKRMRKKQTVSEIRETVALVRRETKIRVTGFFILGYPGETLEDVRNTIRFATELPIHHPHFCVFEPIPGTAVYEELRRQGLIPPEGLEPEQLTFDKPSLALPGLPGRELVRLHQWAYLRFYLKPWRIWNLLTELKSPGHIWVILRRMIKLLG